MAIHTDLPIYRTGTELLAMGYVLQRDMPRGFKRSLGEKIVQGCTDMLELMALANATRDAERAANIQRLMVQLRATTVTLRVAHDLRAIRRPGAGRVRCRGSLHRLHHVTVHGVRSPNLRALRLADDRTYMVFDLNALAPDLAAELPRHTERDRPGLVKYTLRGRFSAGQDLRIAITGTAAIAGVPDAPALRALA